MNEKRYLDVDELSQYLGISKWLIYKYIKNRGIPFIPFGRLVRFDRMAVEKWAEKKMVRDGGQFRRMRPELLQAAETLLYLEKLNQESLEHYIEPPDDLAGQVSDGKRAGMVQ
ncbi:MAG: helix-turn-helix domain-containing protein [Elusimicrobia bacterium]|nr:helix-turn-helix domain-containing protein [Elusimicrobiota bacterium]MDE2424483.1 helix-turn-helix domain-containing protein [Elusimicrobiota bacterium]